MVKKTAVVIALIVYAGLAATEVTTVRIEGLFDRAYPADLHLVTGAGGVQRAILTAPLRVIRGGYNRVYEGRWPVWTVPDISALTVSAGTISGTITASMEHPYLDTPRSVTVDLDASIDGSAISGSYTGELGPFDHGKDSFRTDTSSAVSGLVSGTLSEAPSISPMSLALVFIHSSSQGDAYELVVDFSGGAYASGDLRYLSPRTSTYGDPNGTVQTTLSEAGHIQPYLDREGSHIGAHTVGSGSGSLTSDSVNLQVSIQGPDVGGDYTVRGAVFGNRVCGTIARSGGDSYPFVGRLAVRRPVPTWKPAYAPVVPVSSNGSASSFDGPYFQPVADSKERIVRALQWLQTSAELGPFHADELVITAASTGTKQYDGAPFNGYAAAGGMRLLYDLASDAATKRHARSMAERGGYFLIIQGNNRYGFPEIYKTMGWFYPWAGYAYLDLYGMTGNEVWLRRAKMLANGFRELQRSSGTWTYIAGSGGYSDGESCERNDRSYDNEDLQCAEILLFLGRLRAEAGVDDYAGAEDDAYAWMKGNVNSNQDALWNAGTCIRPGASLGPTMYALYLVKYRSDYSDAHLNRVIDYIESTYADWSPFEPGVAGSFTPSISDPVIPRGKGGGQAYTSARMAVVYALVHKKNGDNAALAKARALFHATLASQDMETGMIHYSGLRNLSADPMQRALEDEHQWSGLKADVLVNLHEAMTLLMNTGAVEAARPHTWFTHDKRMSPARGEATLYDLTGRMIGVGGKPRSGELPTGVYLVNRPGCVIRKRIKP
ncbi:MAG: hypothetical protein GF350_04375 [Chitinivibrionales bacterium]|nr:hypothetical protein [Chitinivibrionales bacterium]